MPADIYYQFSVFRVFSNQITSISLMHTLLTNNVEEEEENYAILGEFFEAIMENGFTNLKKLSLYGFGMRGFDICQIKFHRIFAL